MKKSLGKIAILLLLSISSLLEASQLASYSLQANKTNIYEKEAVEITFTAKQLDHTDEMFFFLVPKKNDRYKIELLNQENKRLSRHDTTSTFHYLLFPLKSGQISVDFDFTVKTASDDAVAQIYTGGRNNVKWMDTVDTKVKIRPLLLHVTGLKEHVDLVGDFELQAKLQSDHIDKYGAANIRYYLNGTGYFDDNLTLLSTINGVQIFSETKDNLIKGTTKGYEIQKEFAYALVSEKDFTIPTVKLRVFSPKQNRYYTLRTKSYNINVSAIEPKTLLDQKESPQKDELDLSIFKDALWAIVIFFSGFFTAKFMPSLQRTKNKRPLEDIRSADNPKQLILILLQNYSEKNIQEFVNDLEQLEYKRSTKSFKEIKQDILKKFM